MSASTAPTEKDGKSTHRRDGQQDAVRLRVAYVVSVFPCWSETFIAEEIQHLLDMALDIQILSLKPASEREVQDLSRRLLPRALYADSFLRLLMAQLHYLFRRPRAYLLQFLRVMAGAGFSPAELAKFVVTFILAVYFARVVEERGIRHVHAHWATYPTTAAWTIHSLTGVPFSFTTHAHDLFCGDRLLAQKLQHARFVITISEHNRGLLRRLCNDVGKIHVIHCGVDARRFIPVEHYDWEGARILAVGRLDPIKGFDVLIEACRILKERGQRFSCEIVGAGPLEKALRDQIARSGVEDCVRLSGFAPQEEVMAKLRRAAVFALPSQVTQTGNRDGIPVALMEAMSMGVPVASTTVSGIPELVQDGQSGLLVPAGNPRAFADALQSLLSDRQKCMELALGGQATVSREFDARKNARQLGQMFLEQV
jgi:glycosyltransferase involved in cell wall biosynthesis